MSGFGIRSHAPEQICHSADLLMLTLENGWVEDVN
jgi:hypothetical protein